MIARPSRVGRPGFSLRAGGWVRAHRWIAAAVALIAVSVAFVVATGIRPEYDAYGWLVWGRQATHLDLNTNAAPSWKPLTFLFTFPYALAGRGAVWLWMVTAVAAALAAVVFAARIAYRLAGGDSRPRYAQLAAAVLAGFGVLVLGDYWHYILISASDPMVVALCLAAIDLHLSRRPRLAWLALVLASLGRPEVWPIAAVYAVWGWRAVRSMRPLIAGGAVVVPALWFGIAALTSPSWSIAADVATDSTSSLPHHGASGVVHGFYNLYAVPMRLAVLLGLVLAVACRDRTWLLLAGAVAVWVLVEIGFAVHGWTGAARYMFEPAAVLVVLAGAAVGRVLSIRPRRLALVRWAAAAAVVALVVALIPPTRTRVKLARNEVTLLHAWARQIDRLHAVIREEGGPRRILGCGQAVTVVAFQSILAWEIGENVADVGWNPDRWIARGKPIVLFWPQGAGWEVRPIHIPARSRARCARLWTNTAFS